MVSPNEMLQAYQPYQSEYRLLVGFEYEVQLFDLNLVPLKYDRLSEILEEARRRIGGKAVSEAVFNKVVLPGGGLLSLEPGGQFEFSSAPTPNFLGCVKQIEWFDRLLSYIKRRFGVHVFYGGVNPVHTVDEIGLVLPTERYKMMNDYFPRVGTMGRRMMRQSCSVQVTFDYQNPELGTDLLRTACFLSPFAAAIFANAPFVDGERTEYRSYRAAIWDDTDSARSGLPPGFHRPDYSFKDYLDFVVEAPMFFLDDYAGGLVDAECMRFSTYNRDGFRGRSATLDDFLRHNSTIFTDVRLKHTVEVRSIDGQDPDLVPSVLAFLSGLLLCSAARQRAKEVLSTIDAEAYCGLNERLGREGISGEVDGRPVAELVMELIDVAADGLTNCFVDGTDALPYLEPLRRLAAQAQTPADVVLGRFETARAWLEAGRTFGPGGATL